MCDTVLFLCPHGAAKSVLAAANLHQPARSELWDDVPAPSQDLQGAYAGIRQHLAEWIAAYGARSRARRPIEGGER
jgi:hypothetical protein